MTIEDRIVRLERDARRWQRIGIGLALVLAILLGHSATGINSANDLLAAPEAPPIEKIQTKLLEIVTPGGEVVGSFFATDGGAWLALGAANRKGAVLLSSESLGGPLCMFSGENSAVTISDKAIKVSTISAERKRQRELVGKRGIQTPDDLSAFDSDPIVMLGTTETGGGILNVNNPFGKTVVSAQCDKTNQGSVFVFDVTGKLVNSLSR